MKVRTPWFIYILIGSFLALPSPVLGKKMTGREIMKKQRDHHKTKTEYESQRMILVDKKGNKEERALLRYVKEFKPNLYRTLVVFTEPADIKGTALLSWQQKGRDDDQWLYLPSQKKLQRIAKGSKKNYFMGTDFTYEDLEGESLESWKYELKKEEEVQGKKAYVVEAKPKNKKAAKESSYGRRVMWIDKSNLMTLKIEFYSKRGKLIKHQENRDLKSVSGTIWRVDKSIVDNKKKKHKTLMVATDREVNLDIPNKVFTEPYILKGKHLQKSF